MKLKKMFFAGALVGAMGIGAMIGPAVTSANTNPVPTPTAQLQQQNTQTGWVGMGLRMGQYFAGAMHDKIATFLGLDSQKLYDQRSAGKSLEQITVDQKKNPEDVEKMLIDNKKAQLDQLVKDKKITEEQKAFMLERMETQTDAAMKNTQMGGRGKGGMQGQGQGYGRGAGGGGPRWATNNTTTNN